MTWTYTGLAFTTALAQIRVEIGDTDTTDQLLTDEEIAYAQTVEGGVLMSAARCCEWLAAKFARKADKQVGPLSISLGQKAEAYALRAAALRRGGSSLALPVAGGVSVSRKDTVEENTDRVEPRFRAGMMSNPDRLSSVDLEEQ